MGGKKGQTRHKVSRFTNLCNKRKRFKTGPFVVFLCVGAFLCFINGVFISLSLSLSLSLSSTPWDGCLSCLISFCSVFLPAFLPFFSMPPFSSQNKKGPSVSIARSGTGACWGEILWSNRTEMEQNSRHGYGHVLQLIRRTGKGCGFFFVVVSEKGGSLLSLSGFGYFRLYIQTRIHTQTHTRPVLTLFARKRKPG